MYRDQDFIWDEGDFPYDVLAAAEINPQSGVDEIIKAMNVVAKSHPGDKHLLRQVSQARAKLQDNQERLRIDFFLYRDDYGSGANDGSESIE